MNLSSTKYTELCNKFFAPLDEIAEALQNNEGLLNMSFRELVFICHNNDELTSDLDNYYDVDTFDLI